ncbi:hypothetical protein Tco_0260673 [Tanacetum coccineum]
MQGRTSSQFKLQQVFGYWWSCLWKKAIWNKMGSSETRKLKREIEIRNKARSLTKGLMQADLRAWSQSIGMLNP